MSDQLKHATHLLVASLVKQDFKPRVRLRLVELLDSCRRGARAVFERDAASQSENPAFSRHTFDFDFVDFLDAIASRRDEVSEIAVVREQQETFGVEVEPSNRHPRSVRCRQRLGRDRRGAAALYGARLSADFRAQPPGNQWSQYD